MKTIFSVQEKSSRRLSSQPLHHKSIVKYSIPQNQHCMQFYVSVTPSSTWAKNGYLIVKFGQVKTSEQLTAYAFKSIKIFTQDLINKQLVSKKLQLYISRVTLSVISVNSRACNNMSQLTLVTQVCAESSSDNKIARKYSDTFGHIPLHSQLKSQQCINRVYYQACKESDGANCNKAYIRT